jgi:hypothetical protein
MALAVTSGLSRTCAVSGLVTHYTYAHDQRNLRKEALCSTRSDRINNNNNVTVKLFVHETKQIERYVLMSYKSVLSLLMGPKKFE